MAERLHKRIMKQSFRAYAKINVSLDITGVREDGYHNLLSVMQSVGIYDTITVETGCGSGINITTDCPYLATDKRNIVYKAVSIFCEKTGINDGINVNIEKNIPMGAGLGGGSADAAVTLITLNGIYKNPLSDSQLYALGLSCGADVPFCMKGGTCLAQGLGEILTPLPPFPSCFILIVKPAMSVNTKSAFADFDKTECIRHPQTEKIIESIRNGNTEEIARRVYNVLEDAVRPRYKELDKFKGIMLDSGALGSAMTGSGSAVFGLFSDRQSAVKAQRRFQRLNINVFLTKPVKERNHGHKINASG